MPHLTLAHAFSGAFFLSLCTAFCSIVGSAGVNTGWFTAFFTQEVDLTRDPVLIERYWKIGLLKLLSTYPQNLMPSSSIDTPADWQTAAMASLAFSIITTVVSLLVAAVLFFTFNPRDTPGSQDPLPGADTRLKANLGAVSAMAVACFCAFLSWVIYLVKVYSWFSGKPDIQDISLSVSWAWSFQLLSMFFAVGMLVMQCLRIWYIPSLNHFEILRMTQSDIDDIRTEDDREDPDAPALFKEDFDGEVSNDL